VRATERAAHLGRAWTPTKRAFGPYARPTAAAVAVAGPLIVELLALKRDGRLPGGGVVYALAATAIAASLWLPVKYAFGVDLIWLLSPVNRDGNLFQSSVIAVVIVAALSAKVIIGQKDLDLRVPKSLVGPFVLFGIVILAYSLLGLLAHHSLYLVLWDVEPLAEFAAFGLLALSALKNFRDAEAVVLILLAGAVVKACYDLILFLNGVTLADLTLFSILSNRILDVVPFLLVPVGLFFGLSSKSLDRKLSFVLAGTAVIAVVLLASFTRSLWLGLLVGVASGLIVDRSQTSRRILKIVGLIMVAVALLLPIPVVRRTASLVVSREAFTITQLLHPPTAIAARRQNESEVAFAAIEQSHFLGSGEGATIPATFATTNVEKRLATLHNYNGVPGLHDYYLQVLWKLGLIGFIVFLWCGLSVVRLLVRKARSLSGLQRGLALGVIAVWAMEGIQMALYNALSIYHIPAFLAVTLAMVIVISRTAGSTLPAVSKPEVSEL